MSVANHSLGSAEIAGELASGGIVYLDTGGSVGVALSAVSVSLLRLQNTVGACGVALSATASGQCISNSSGSCAISLLIAGQTQRVSNTGGAVTVDLSAASSAQPRIVFGASGACTIVFSMGSGLADVLTVIPSPPLVPPALFVVYGAGSLQYMTSDGFIYCVKAEASNFSETVFQYPRLAPGAGTRPRVLLQRSPCPTPALEGVTFTLDGLLDDFAFTGALVGGVVLTGGASIEDVLFAVTTDSGAYLSASVSVDDILLSAANSIASGRPTVDFLTPSKWNILRGTIDLCGRGPNGELDGGATDVRPGNGMYLDMCGTNVIHSPDGVSINAKLRSKQSYSFVAGSTYRLSFNYCSYDPTFAAHYMDVSIGNSGEVVTPTRVSAIAPGPFVFRQIVWTQAANATAPIIFDHGPESSTIGLLLDRVKLENLTLGEEMFYDSFDYENP